MTAHVEEAFLDYLEGELPVAELERVEAHLHDCDECAKVLADMRRVRELYAGLESEDVSPGIAAEILEASGVGAQASSRLPWRTIAAAALILLATGWLFFVSGGAGGPTTEEPFADMRALEERGEWERALAGYQALLAEAQSEDERSRLHLRLGAVELELGRDSDAVARLGALLATNPDYEHWDEVLLLRARGLERLGETAMALDAYEHLAATFPALEEAQEKVVELRDILGLWVELEALGYIDGGE